MVWEYHESDRPWDSNLVAVAQEPQINQNQLTDLALEGIATLRCWYDLGSSLGHYMVQVHGHEGGPLPPVDGLLAAARALPVASVSSLSRLVELSDQQLGLLPRSLLTQAMVSGEEASRLEVFGADADAYVVNRLLLKLDADIQDGLGGMTNLGPAVAAKHDSAKQLENPNWNKETGELRWKGQVVRHVVARAANVIQILDAFEEQGWPFKIKDPLALEIQTSVGAKPQVAANLWRLHDTIKSLNHGLKGLRFHADGASEGISWQPLETS